jgi:predicted XRE-type DNA-binding protein
MSYVQKPAALKHGAFSEMLILPGEDPAEFERLKSELFDEYKPSGISEERTVLSIAKALWQEQRLTLYKQIETVKFVGQQWLSQHPAAEWVGVAREQGGSSATGSVELSTEAAEVMAASQFGRLVTLDHLSKELDVELKIQAKIDRLFKRLYQQKAWKQIDVVAVRPIPPQIESPPLTTLLPPPNSDSEGATEQNTTAN